LYGGDDLFSKLFLKGAGSVGNLFPEVEPPQDSIPLSAWEAVASSFAQAGDSLYKALNQADREP